MKTNYLFTGLTLAAMLLASCEADDTAEIVINNTDNSTTTVNNGDTGGGEEPDPTGEEINLQGTKTSDLVLDPINTYTLTGGLIMAPGTKLTIPAGMTIKASSGASVFIAISQGATIDAQGTASEPIVLTSASAAPVAGDWGGLILLGKAPINSVSGNATSTSEIGGLPYGGTDPGDYSGIIKYLRIEYSGGAADSSSENNGFSFYGVGNNTVVDHIQAYEGKDDGMEFFGGTVNVNYIYVTGAQDDSVDWTEGFSGQLNNVYIVQGAEHDKGIEADGFNTDIGNNSDPVYFAKPTVSNIHIVGAGEGEAVRLRAGTQGVFSNMIIEDFALAYHIVGDATNSPTGQGVLDGDLSVTDVNFVNVTTKLENETTETFTEADFISGDGNATDIDFATWGAGWTRD
tara:strand:+ start:24863 stop:26068 length:1206 start_codon:yes stop_codon:yes gene_type:complete